MRPTRGAAILATAAVMAGGLTACGEDEPTQPTTTASPIDKSTETETPSPSSSSASEDPDDLPADMPAEARERTKEGAAAFGKYYYEVMGVASHEGKTTDLAKLSLDNCPPCEQVVEDIEADARRNRVRGADPYRFSELTATERPDEGYKVSMHVEVLEHKVYENDEVIGTVEATSYTLTEQVVWTDDRWQIADWAIS